jgi:VanZ family protein
LEVDVTARAKRAGARDIVLAWLPAAAYMLLIWLLSSAALPTFPTSSFPFRDKGVHVCEYGVLGFLLAHACLRTFPTRPALRVALVSVMLTMAWGLFDEIHQAFVPGRSADVLDLGADALGALVGTAARTVLSLIFRARDARAQRTQPGAEP